MRALGRVGRLFLFVVAGTLVMISQSQAAESCHKSTPRVSASIMAISQRTRK